MALAEKDFSRVNDALMPRLVHPDRLEDEPLRDIIDSMAHDLGKDVFNRQQHAIIDRIDSRPHLEKIDCPTLILCGREDLITPVDLHQEMAAAIPESSMVVIENCGHLSTLERPEAVTEAMKEWLVHVIDGKI